MADLDHLVLQFEPNQLLLLNICLGILMFGVALDLKWSDFNYVCIHPKSVIVGMISQLVLLPLMTIGLIFLIKPSIGIATGMILIASCPGGNVSNYAVHLARGNSALSIILTTISTLLCAFTTPFLFKSLQGIVLRQTNDDIKIFSLNFWDMASTIALLIIIPIMIAAILNHFLPSFIDKIKAFVKKLSFAIFIGFIIFAVKGHYEELVSNVHLVFFIVFIHNGLALLLGYLWSHQMMKLSRRDGLTIAIETGIQNSGLALILIFNYFNGMGSMAMLAATWSIWHLISSLSLALFWRRYKLDDQIHKV